MTRSSAETSPVDAAAILTSVWKRNELRRGAQLPLLPTRETFESDLRRERYRAFLEENFDRVRDELLVEFRAKHGPDYGITTGQRWRIHLRTMNVLLANYRSRR